ncbi:MAG TPA: metallophosphoesterase [Thermoanaerobaculia bacterium]|nr:metallophosphoesterase [Thermoanaerobaculia bacterium]
MPRRQVYVISDLHLGGDPAEPGIPGGRGFQICRQGRLVARFVRALAGRSPGSLELIINGDIVDFLAEHGRGGGWQPFHRDPAEASRILRLIARDREPEVFAALRDLVAAEHRLTLILGNHDLELALPAVRRELREILGGDEARLQFIYDNEAYVAGRAVIEHGNRVDSMNEVDHDQLRRVRVLQSRQADSEAAAPFTPPVGSRLVTELMNPLKVRFPFIDLLKPEAEAMVPILLALEPSVLSRLPRMLVFGALGGAKAAVDRLAPRYGGEISADGGAERVGDIVRRCVGEQDAAALFALVERHEEPGGEISSQARPAWRAATALQLLRRLVRDDRTFDMAGERGGRYRDAAGEHIGNGFQAVVFGHTHRACREEIADANGGRGVYLNSGTWIDLIQLPEAILLSQDAAAEAMQRFLDDLTAGSLEGWVVRRPTYVRLDIAESGHVEKAGLWVYREEDPDAAANCIAE